MSDKPQHQCLCRAAGSGVPFEIGGDLRIIYPLRLKDWGVIEQHLLVLQKKAVPLDDLTSELFEVIRNETKVHKSIDLVDLFNYSTDLNGDGPALRLWLALRQQETYAQCQQWIRDLAQNGSFRDIVVIQNQADGIDMFALLDWPDRQPQWVEEMAGKKEKNRVVDWKVEAHALAELFHLDPISFGELTLYQVRLLQWDLKSLQGTAEISFEKLRGMRRLHSGKAF